MPTKNIGHYLPPEPLSAVRDDLLVQINATVRDTCACDRAEVLGAITSTGLMRRRTRTLADGAGFATNSPNGVVEDASIFRTGDVLKNSAGTTIGTVAANGVNTATDTITLTANAAVAVPDGAAVLGSDGSQIAGGISDDASDGVGDTTIGLVIGGYLKEALIKGLDATAKAELGAKSLPGGILKV